MKTYLHTVDNMSAEINVAETENPPQMTNLDKKLHLQDIRAEYFCVRRVVAEKLNMASALLPKGYHSGCLKPIGAKKNKCNFGGRS